MAADNPSIMSHVSLGTNRFAEARAFYAEVLGVLGCRVIMEHPGAVAFGKAFPEFWVQEPIDGHSASCGNGTHVGFFATSRDQVDEFHRTALACGATDDGAPGGRSDYGEPYYGCFLRDLDGHKIEAAFWDEEMARTPGLS